MPLIEFECANLQFFDDFKLAYLVIFGPKTNIQVPEEVPKANLVMLSNKNFHLEPFLLDCFTISGIRIAIIWIWLILLLFLSVFKLVWKTILGTKINIQGPEWLAKPILVIFCYIGCQGGPNRVRF